MNVLVVVGSLSVVSFCFGALNGSARAETPSSQSISVAVTKTACDPDELTAQAGDATFSIFNSTPQPVEWEILDGVRVVDERENIPPGEARTLPTKLAPGDYQITCGLISNPKGSLHVEGAAGARQNIASIQLVGPLAEYRFFAAEEIDGLVEDMGRLRDALKSGNIASARALYPTVHAHYARIAPIALYFPDLDGADDPQDSGGAGFRQLALKLSEKGDGSFMPLADKLVADIAVMQRRFEELPLTPGPTFVGAVQSIGGGAAAVAGQSEPLSDADFADLEGYVEGAAKIVDLFQPLLQKSDKSLSVALTGDFSLIDATLAKYRRAGDDRPVRLSPEDRALLQQAIKRAAADLGQIPSALGTG